MSINTTNLEIRASMCRGFGGNTSIQSIVTPYHEHFEGVHHRMGKSCKPLPKAVNVVSQKKFHHLGEHRREGEY